MRTRPAFPAKLSLMAIAGGCATQNRMLARGWFDLNYPQAAATVPPRDYIVAAHPRDTFQEGRQQ